MTTTTTTTIARGKYHIWTVGCQMNQADSQRVQTMLDEMGWEETSMEQANLVILNTCSVRKAPEEKAHNQLALLKHAKSKRSDLLVALMGCMIGNQKTIDELSKRYPHIDLFMKVEQADILPRFLEERWTPISGAGCLDIEYSPGEPETSNRYILTCTDIRDLDHHRRQTQCAADGDHSETRRAHRALSNDH